MNTLEVVSFLSEGTTLTGKFYIPCSINKDYPSPIVMVATGDGINGSNSGTWKPLIDKLNKADLPVFIFDFYSLGDSDGDIKKFTPTIAVQNTIDAIKVLHKYDWIDKKRIGILGSSFGGAMSLIAQSRTNAFKAIGLKSPVSFIPESYETELDNDLLEWKEKGKITNIKFHFNAYLDSMNYNIYQLANNITAKTFIIHGDSDTVVPIEQSKRLSIILPNSVLLIFKGVNHGYKEKGSLQMLISKQVKFFKENL